MMGIHGVSNQAVFIANLCCLAEIGLLITAQWEMVRGNTFSYTVLAAFGRFLLTLSSCHVTYSNEFIKLFFMVAMVLY